MSLHLSLAFLLSIDLCPSPILSSASSSSSHFPYNMHIVSLPRIPNLCPTFFLLLSHFPLFSAESSSPPTSSRLSLTSHITPIYIHPSPDICRPTFPLPCSNPYLFTINLSFSFSITSILRFLPTHLSTLAYLAYILSLVPTHFIETIIHSRKTLFNSSTHPCTFLGRSR